MIDTSAFSTAQGLTNLEASITIVGTNLTNNCHTKTQTDGFLNATLNSAGPAWTSTATGLNLTLTGNLLVQGSNIITSLASKRNISDSYNRTETDSFLATKIGYAYDSTLLKDSVLTDILRPKKAGNTNIICDADIAVVGNCNITYGLFVDGLDIVASLNTKATTTNLNLKANTSDVYTKTAIVNAHQPKIDTFVSPLTCIFNLATSKNELSIDSTAILSIGAIDALSNCTIGGNLTVNGFIVAKPFASLRVATAGGTPSTGTTAGLIEHLEQ